MKFQKFNLAQGVTVVCERHPSSRSLCIGYWVPRGTRHEQKKHMGISHFLEHLVFKGTKSRSAFDIAKYLESYGGDLNAFTSREHTCFHATVLESDWKRAVTILSDLVQNMDVKKNDFEIEKKVILQEIAMAEDQIEEYIFDEFLAYTLKTHPLGWSILGTTDSVQGISQKSVKEYYRDHYSANNLLVSVAGKFQPEDIIPELSESLKALAKKGRSIRKETPPKWHRAHAYLEKNLEQVQVMIGFPVTSYRDKERFHAFILNTLIGGGMTSRLYQAVREKKGLAYSIYSSLNTFTDIGFIGISAATQPENLKKLVEVIQSELRKIRDNGIKKTDLELFKRQLHGSILLGSEDLENRMNSIAINEMVLGQYKSPDAIIKGIDKITLDQMNDYIRRYLKFENFSCVALGPKSADAQKFWEEWRFS